MIRAGGVLCAIALVPLALLVTWPIKVAAFALAGLGFYMIHNSMQTQATELAPAARGAALALHAFFFFLGHAAGPIVFGATRGLVGSETAILIGASAILAVGLITAWRLDAAGRPAPPN